MDKLLPRRDETNLLKCPVTFSHYQIGNVWYNEISVVSVLYRDDNVYSPLA